VNNCLPKAFCLRLYIVTVDMVRLIFYAVFLLLQKHSTTVKQQVLTYGYNFGFKIVTKLSKYLYASLFGSFFP